uniref:KRAB domain-containing protein n=1 Tax=Podarcis muralis TaxID=64176 RepID=A0A670HQJ6_PODMU
MELLFICGGPAERQKGYWEMIYNELKNCPVSFEDVAVFFAEEEWSLLDPDQRALHSEVMEDNCLVVTSLGKAPSFPSLQCVIL